MGPQKNEPGLLMAASLAKSSFHFPLPSASVIACNTPFMSPAYTTPATTAGGAKIGALASYIHRRSPDEISKARTLPSVAQVIAKPSASATDPNRPPGTSLCQSGLPLARSKALISPFAPLTLPGSKFNELPATITVLSSTEAPPHGLIFNGCRQRMLPFAASRQKTA